MEGQDCASFICPSSASVAVNDHARKRTIEKFLVGEKRPANNLSSSFSLINCNKSRESINQSISSNLLVQNTFINVNENLDDLNRKPLLHKSLSMPVNNADDEISFITKHMEVLLFRKSDNNNDSSSNSHCAAQSEDLVSGSIEDEFANLREERGLSKTYDEHSSKGISNLCDEYRHEKENEESLFFEENELLNNNNKNNNLASKADLLKSNVFSNNLSSSGILTRNNKKSDFVSSISINDIHDKEKKVLSKRTNENHIHHQEVIAATYLKDETSDNIFLQKSDIPTLSSSLYKQNRSCSIDNQPRSQNEKDSKPCGELLNLNSTLSIPYLNSSKLKMNHSIINQIVVKSPRPGESVVEYSPSPFDLPSINSSFQSNGAFNKLDINGSSVEESNSSRSSISSLEEECKKNVCKEERKEENDNEKEKNALNDDEMTEDIYNLIPKDENGNILSAGSILHDDNTCKPCVFFQNPAKGCRNGIRCLFCHFYHQPKKRIRYSKKKIAEKLKEAEMNPLLNKSMCMNSSMLYLSCLSPSNKAARQSLYERFKVYVSSRKMRKNSGKVQKENSAEMRRAEEGVKNCLNLCNNNHAVSSIMLINSMMSTSPVASNSYFSSFPVSYSAAGLSNNNNNNVVSSSSCYDNKNLANLYQNYGIQRSRTPDNIPDKNFASFSSSVPFFVFSSCPSSASSSSNAASLEFNNVTCNLLKQNMLPHHPAASPSSALLSNLMTASAVHHNTSCNPNMHAKPSSDLSCQSFLADSSSSIDVNTLIQYLNNSNFLLNAYPLSYVFPPPPPAKAADSDLPQKNASAANAMNSIIHAISHVQNTLPRNANKYDEDSNHSNLTNIHSANNLNNLYNNSSASVLYREDTSPKLESSGSLDFHLDNVNKLHQEKLLSLYSNNNSYNTNNLHRSFNVSNLSFCSSNTSSMYQSALNSHPAFSFASISSALSFLLLPSSIPSSDSSISASSPCSQNTQSANYVSTVAHNDNFTSFFNKIMNNNN